METASGVVGRSRSSLPWIETHDFFAFQQKGSFVVDTKNRHPSNKSAMSTDLAIYLATKRGMMAGDVLFSSSPIGLVAGVTLNPSPQVKRHGDRPCARAGLPEALRRRQFAALEPGSGDPAAQ
jgi:hypothetical protein